MKYKIEPVQVPVEDTQWYNNRFSLRAGILVNTWLRKRLSQFPLIYYCLL